MNFSRVLTVSLLFISALAHAGWPEIPFPPGTRVESLGEQVRQNGVHMHMYKADIGRGARDVVCYYRDKLGHSVAEQSILGDRVLSQVGGNYFITIRVRPVSGAQSLVLVSVSDASEAHQAAYRGSGIELPPDSSIQSDMASVDAGRNSRQLVILNRCGLKTNLRVFGKELARRGLRPSPVRYRAVGDSIVQLYEGDKCKARLTMVRKDGVTRIVL
ncbi:MAG: hypothetical protein P4L70_12700, partial [Parasulfuritortus sp.]|nr:hypothetical protein [Parasulfuritortus sp.]